MDSALRLLFHEVADLTRSEREKLFAERQIDPELRAEIESLLTFDSTSDDSLTKRVANAAKEALESDHDDGVVHWGPYRRVRVLGTGNTSRGIEIYLDLLGRVLATKPNAESRLADALALSDIYSGAAKLNRQAGQVDIASNLDARRIEIWQIWKDKLPNNDFVRRQIEAVSLRAISIAYP